MADTTVSRDPRRLAWETLQAVSTQDAYANLVLPGLLSRAGLDTRDAALATELGYGTLRAEGILDAILQECSSRELAELDVGVLNLLRLGAYQLLKTRVPAHAAVDTTVELSRATGNGRASGFVNAVLRKVSARSYDGWVERIGAGASELGMLALRYAHPGWIVAAFDDALGQDSEAELAEALDADDTRPETHLVAWPGRIDRDALAEQAGGTAGPYSPFAVRLTAGGEPGALPAIRDHQAGVQDEGSQLCALALSRLPLTGPDTRWLDLCAGPGGKAALLAALAAQRDAELTANELHPHRAELIRRAVEGWPVTVTVGDALRMTPDERGYDRILLDAPCTGLGALRRRPEARWRKDPSDLVELVALQRGLLQAAISLLRPGGVLAYVTCSPHPAETRAHLETALDDGLVELIDARPVFSEIADVPELGEFHTVQLWPHRHGTDAMFFAALRRVADGATL